MATDRAALTCLHTRGGLIAARDAVATGTMAPLSHIAFGQGEGPHPDATSGRGYAPTRDQTALRSERLRVPIAPGSKIVDAYTRTYQALVPAALAGEPQFMVYEIGFFLADGTLAAVWSDPDDLRFFRGPHADTAVAYTLTHEGVPPDAFGFIASGPTVNLVFDAEFGAQAALNATLARQVLELRRDATTQANTIADLVRRVREHDEHAVRIRHLEQRP